MKPVTIGEVEQLAHTLAKRLMTWDEPIPPFETRRPGVLEGCLLAPFQTFGGKRLYQGLSATAAVMFYIMIKDHPFQNGNKRIAVTTLFVFLNKNGHWLHVNEQELYNFAKWVAASNPKLKQSTVTAIQDFINLYVVKE